MRWAGPPVGMHTREVLGELLGLDDEAIDALRAEGRCDHCVEIVDVGPRDGFQSVGPFIPTGTKIALIRALHAAGVRRIEATAFVSTAAVPQLADAAEIVSAVQALDGLDAQVLVPTARQAERALQAGARSLAFVLSVSEHQQPQQCAAHARGIGRGIRACRRFAALVCAASAQPRHRLRLPLCRPGRGGRCPIHSRPACGAGAAGGDRVVRHDGKGVARSGRRSVRRGRGALPRGAALGFFTRTTRTDWARRMRWRPGIPECACSMRRAPASAAVPSLPARPATSPAKIWSGCSRIWA